MKNLFYQDLHTHLDAKEFYKITDKVEQNKLSQRWHFEMNVQNQWISFFEWRKQFVETIDMMQSRSQPAIEQPQNITILRTPKDHLWLSREGKEFYTDMNFPHLFPFKLQYKDTSTPIVPIVLNLSKQDLPEQVNWTNSALKGVALHNLEIQRKMPRVTQIDSLHILFHRIYEEIKV